MTNKSKGADGDDTVGFIKSLFVYKWEIPFDKVHCSCPSHNRPEVVARKCNSSVLYGVGHLTKNSESSLFKKEG